MTSSALRPIADPEEQRTPGSERVAAVERLLARPAPAPLTRARELAREAGRARRAALPTNLAPFDRLLGGGLPRGRLVELCGRRSSGRFSVVLSALAAATGLGEAAALVDLGSGLDPQLAAAAAVRLERLLWVRPRRLAEALIGGELLLHSGFPLVVLDLGPPPLPGGRGVEAAWLRLARSAAAQGAALLVSSPYRVSGTAASAVVSSRGARPVWRGCGLSPRLLEAARPRLALLKLDGQAVLGRSTSLRLGMPREIPPTGRGA